MPASDSKKMPAAADTKAVLDMRCLSMWSEGLRSQLGGLVVLTPLGYAYGMTGCSQLRSVVGTR